MRHLLLFGCLLVLACSGTEKADAGPLAVDRLETRTASQLEVTSSSFVANGPSRSPLAPTARGDRPVWPGRNCPPAPGAWP